MKKFLFLIALLIAVSLSFSKETGFTQEDRERLIRLETTLKVFMEQTDKRFEELREDINKRFEQVDKRFEQINRELDRLINIMIGIFAGQIALVVAVIGFAYWDRRTIVRKAKEEVFEDMERELKPEKFKKLLEVLREKAKTDRELETILRKYGLM